MPAADYKSRGISMAMTKLDVNETAALMKVIQTIYNMEEAITKSYDHE